MAAPVEGDAAISGPERLLKDDTSKNTSRVFSIPAGSDFLGTLAGAFLDGVLIDGFAPREDPLLLPESTIYVPNRRAARALSTAFLSCFDGRATLLPKIRTLGDTDTNEFGLFAEFEEPALLEEPIDQLQRKLHLAGLVQAWRESISHETKLFYDEKELRLPANPSESIYLANELTVLLDQITQEEIDWNNIQNLVPTEHAHWWELTSTFLGIIIEHWPQFLADNNLLDPAERSVKLLKLRAQRYREHGSSGPVIIAGSTGSVPSTRMLLNAVAELPNGAIVLPGLDREINEQEWKRLQSSNLSDDPLIESHSQFGLARTLENLGIHRNNVIDVEAPKKEIATRNVVVGMALSLSEFSSGWLDAISVMEQDSIEAAFEQVSLVEAANERQEALAIAVAMRETLEQKNKSAALVTPDRNLAARVSMELRRFGIEIDDSAGMPLAESPAGQFARLVCLLGTSIYSNADLAAVLKHQFFRVGQSRERSEKLALQFEHVALRGHISSPKIGKFADHLQEIHQETSDTGVVHRNHIELEESDWEALKEWALAIDLIFSDFRTLSSENELYTPRQVFACLQSAIVQLSLDENASPVLNDAKGANELANLFSALSSSHVDELKFPISESYAVFNALLSGHVYRSTHSTHSRLHIYGPLEARLLDNDRIILAGLNEDNWPQNHRNDAFLNRSMRRTIGMPSPERRTGLAAHDFQQLIATTEVILTRSARVDNAPTVASRWVQRIIALIGKDHSHTLRLRGDRYLAWATLLDAPQIREKRVARPNEKPPVEARPAKLPVTDIETWIRDPYALYAKRILNLTPIAPLEREADALLKGTIYHQIMEAYISKGGPDLEQNDREQLLNALASDFINDHELPENIDYIWKLRFQEIAKAYVDWEVQYQASNATYQSYCEIEGKIDIGESGFTLSARADRIDVNGQNESRVYDYKTGSTPSPKQARGFSPQLSLEAMIAEHGGFAGIPKLEITDLRYLRLRNDALIGAENILTKDETIRELIDRSSRNLSELVAAYQHLDQGYISRRAPFKDSEMSGDYDHLARVREWSFGEEEGDE